MEVSNEMTGSFINILSAVFSSSIKPGLFEPGEPRFWDDPHISKGMLEAHLNRNSDAASRKIKIIDREVRHLLTVRVLKPGDRVLDLGCGPGLYATRLSENGIKVTGIDISERSIDYAIRYAKECGLDIDYRCMDFFDMSITNEFDAVLLIYGELCTFADSRRDVLLAKILRALKPGGLFVFDVSTRQLRMKEGLRNRWYVSNSGFWRPGRHMVLEQGFDYPEHDVWLDQYVVMTEDGKAAVYRNWFHDYSLASIRQVAVKAGFGIAHVWNDFTGKPYVEGGDWIAVVAKKKPD